jgi:hypothetical protein
MIPSVADRERIRTSQLINRLQDFAFLTADADETEVSRKNIGQNQLKAIEILLAKSMPNLASVESFNQTEVSVISAEPMTPEAWAEAHGADAGETRQ